MAFTYDEALPTARDRIRLSLGDTDGLDPLLQDETIDAAFDQYEPLGDTAEAITTAFLARSLAARFGRSPSSLAIPGGPTLSYGDRVKSWLETANKMEAAAGRSPGDVSGAGYSGLGMSRSYVELPETKYDPYINSGPDYTREREQWQT